MNTTEPERRFTGRHMLLIMLGFFATVFAANMTMVYFASHSWTGLVVKNSYVASQEFDATTAKMRANAAVDIRPTLSYAAGVLRVTLHTRSGAAVNALAIKVALGRPSHESEDVVLDMAPRGAGVYESTRTFGVGQWTGTITADVPGHGSWSRPVAMLVKG